jgi:hypothetical protein
MLTSFYFAFWYPICLAFNDSRCFAKEAPMKTEISLLGALLALAIYAGTLIVVLVYIVHSFWLVTPQFDPFLVFSLRT